MTDCWNPVQYEKFAIERTEPFYDLIQLISPNENMKVLDLGCGTGELTSRLHDVIHAKMTLGIDSSPAMLEKCKAYVQPNLAFQLQDIDQFIPSEKYDLIFSNAALQWLPNHEKLFARLTGYLSNRGQLAIQVPANFDHPAHVIAKDIAKEIFPAKLGKGRDPSVLTVDQYAQLFYDLGFKEQEVRLQVYSHVLESTESVVEWLKGSLFTYYQSKLSPQEFEEFLQIYRKRLINHYGLINPFFLAFKRMLLWAQL